MKVGVDNSGVDSGGWMVGESDVGLGILCGQRKVGKPGEGCRHSTVNCRRRREMFRSGRENYTKGYVVGGGRGCREIWTLMEITVEKSQQQGCSREYSTRHSHS